MNVTLVARVDVAGALSADEARETFADTLGDTADLDLRAYGDLNTVTQSALVSLAVAAMREYEGEEHARKRSECLEALKSVALTFDLDLSAALEAEYKASSASAALGARFVEVDADGKEG